MVTTPEAMRSRVCAQFWGVPTVVGAGTGSRAGGAGATEAAASGGGSAGGGFSAGAAPMRTDNNRADRSKVLRSMPFL